MKKLFLLGLLALISLSVIGQRPYFTIYQHDSYRGYSKTIYLDDLNIGTLNLSGALQDGISSIIFLSCDEYSVKFNAHHTTDGNFPGRNHTLYGNCYKQSINKGPLKQWGLHDEISSIQVYRNGRLISGETWIH